MWIAAIGLWCAFAVFVAVGVGRVIARSAARITDADHVQVLSRRTARDRANVA